jgi:protein AFG1
MPSKWLKFCRLNYNTPRLGYQYACGGISLESNFSTSPAAAGTNNEGTTTTPSSVYRARVEGGTLQTDPHQLRVIAEFDRLQESLRNYEPPSKPSAMGKFFGSLLTGDSRDKKKGLRIPKGLYIYGAVGGGKTMLMDLFHEVSTVRRKRRVHFHSFMSQAHSEIHRVKQETATDSKSGTRPRVYDPIPPVAADITKESWLLCFDEFQVRRRPMAKN